ncbi:MAG: PD40 domain-containing protein [Candidatus Coatesbacteria bacterium]|nr:MAG: PD40 domain-containing protein [Candidatus Coatesbacteria bacterium]
MAAAIVVGAVALAAPHPAAAFGKNIVHNEKFAWRVFATDHFDIYYYEEEEFLLEWTAELVEAAYDKMSDELEHDLSKRYPVVIFMSARHFEQNNISPVSGEAIGGFTEPLKGRLVMPYNGSQRQYEITLTHEIGHVFQFDVLFPTFGSLFTLNAPPDWFMEGVAEYACEDEAPEGEMVLRDAVMTANVPRLTNLHDFGMLPNPYLGYKLGQSVIAFLVEKYGADAPARLLHAFEGTTLRRSDSALDDAFGIKLADLDEEWQVWLRQRYWPAIGEKAQLGDFATQLTPKDDRREYISYLKPKWSPSGDLVACLTVKERFLDIFLVNAETGEKFENLTKGYALSKYDYLMYLQNGLSWSPDGNYIAFVGKKDTFDQIFVLNIFNRKVVRRYNPRFEDILAPAYSPDGKKIAFAGVESDRRDIFVLDVASGDVRRVTNDFYSDGYPSWSPDGEYIYYASERESFHNVFRIRPDGTGEEQLTFGDHENVSPAVSPDGARLLFVSNRADGVFNLFALDLATREVGRYTDVVTGVMDAAWSPEGDTVAFTSYENMTYSIWTMPWRDEPLQPLVLERPEPGDYGYEWWLARGGSNPGPGEEIEIAIGEEPAGVATAFVGEEAAGEEGAAETGEEASAPASVRELGPTDLTAETRRYRPKFSPDYLYTTFAYTTGGVFTNYSIFGLSDILGGHRLDLMFDLTTIGSYRDLDFAVDYYYITPRTWYMFSGITWQDYYVARNIAFDQRISGGSVLAAYPLDWRNRLEGGLYGYHRSRDYFYEPEFLQRDDNMIGALGRFVRDTSQWGYYHPTAGTRLSYTVRQTAPVTADSLLYTEQILDVRRYIRLSDRVSLAFRAVGGASLGRDPQNFFLGGGSTLRGYSYYQIYGTRFGLGSFEFRMPILDYLVWPVEGMVLGGFRTLFFVDLGSAWGDYDNASEYPDDQQWFTDKEDQKYDRFTFASDEGGWHLVHAKMAFGTGLRWWLGSFDVKLDWGWRTNLRHVETPPRFHFTLGYDF